MMDMKDTVVMYVRRGMVGRKVRDGKVADGGLDSVDYRCTWKAQARDGARRGRRNVSPASLCFGRHGNQPTTSARSRRTLNDGCDDDIYAKTARVHNSMHLADVQQAFPLPGRRLYELARVFASLMVARACIVYDINSRDRLPSHHTTPSRTCNETISRTTIIYPRAGSQHLIASPTERD
jgi:hypothetical protein